MLDLDPFTARAIGKQEEAAQEGAQEGGGMASQGALGGALGGAPGDAGDAGDGVGSAPGGAWRGAWPAAGAGGAAEGPYCEEAGSGEAGSGEGVYDLAGIIVHSGTADAGHYYSFIRERNQKARPGDGGGGEEEEEEEEEEEDTTKGEGEGEEESVAAGGSSWWRGAKQNRAAEAPATDPLSPPAELFSSLNSGGAGGVEAAPWFCFNDASVTAFDPGEIEAQCFGGTERATRWNPYLRTNEPVDRPKPYSAYMLVYDQRSTARRATSQPPRPVPRRRRSQSGARAPPVVAPDVSSGGRGRGLAPCWGEREGALVGVPAQVRAACEAANERWRRDREVFDAGYLTWLARILVRFGPDQGADSKPVKKIGMGGVAPDGAVPSPTPGISVGGGAGGGVAGACRVALCLLFDVAAHAREREPCLSLLGPWLLHTLPRSREACRWFLDATLGGRHWHLDALLLCPHQPVRACFADLALAAARALAPEERSLYRLRPETPHAAAAAAAAAPSATGMAEPRPVGRAEITFLRCAPPHPSVVAPAGASPSKRRRRDPAAAAAAAPAPSGLQQRGEVVRASGPGSGGRLRWWDPLQVTEPTKEPTNGETSGSRSAADAAADAAKSVGLSGRSRVAGLCGALLDACAECGARGRQAGELLGLVRDLALIGQDEALLLMRSVAHSSTLSIDATHVHSPFDFCLMCYYE